MISYENIITSDEGFITQMGLLPVTKMNFGDTQTMSKVGTHSAR